MGNKAGEGIKAPCRAACPAGVDVPRYIRHIKEGEFDLALSVIRESIPFPAVCGYACAHPCEGKCARQQYDEPVAIRLLKRAAYEEGAGKWKDRYASHQ
ncbi:MAG: FAD-dependent oxidoreductase, partial [Desulfocucumaceae bacterium]